MKSLNTLRLIISILLVISVVLNIVLVVVFLSKEPFEHKESQAIVSFSARHEVKFDTTSIQDAQVACYFAHNVWVQEYSEKRSNPYQANSSEETFDIIYLKRLDCWAVTSDQTVGFWKMSPYVFFDSDGKNVITLLSPFEWFS